MLQALKESELTPERVKSGTGPQPASDFDINPRALILAPSHRDGSRQRRRSPSATRAARHVHPRSSSRLFTIRLPRSRARIPAQYLHRAGCTGRARLKEKVVLFGKASGRGADRGRDVKQRVETLKADGGELKINTCLILT